MAIERQLGIRGHLRDSGGGQPRSRDSPRLAAVFASQPLEPQQEVIGPDHVQARESHDGLRLLKKTLIS